jgi:hypothetical protein
MFIKSKSKTASADGPQSSAPVKKSVSAAVAAASASAGASASSAAAASKFAEAREKHAKHSRDLLTPVQYTTYLSSSIISTFEIKSSAGSKTQKLAVDDEKAQQRRLDLLESLLFRLQYQHYSKEQQEMGLQFTNATSSAVSLGALRVLLNYVKWNAAGGRKSDESEDDDDDDTDTQAKQDLREANVPIRWTFLHGHVKVSDMNHEQVREFSLALQCLTKAAVVLASQRDDPKVKTLLKSKQDKQGKAL